MEILAVIFLSIFHFIEINWPYFASAALLITVFAFISADTTRESEKNK